MSPDRYGERTEPSCRNPNCRNGWLGEDEEGRPIPCLDHKPHLIKGTTTTHDYAESTPSLRAQQAIEGDNQP